MFHTSTIIEIWLHSPTRSQAWAVQKKQEQEPVSVCRDVPELGTFSASERATAAMGHNCITSAESPTHLLALSHGSPSSGAFFFLQREEE